MECICNIFSIKYILFGQTYRNLVSLRQIVVIIQMIWNMKIYFFKCQKKRRNCKFGFSVVLYFFSIRTSFFKIFFKIFPKKYVFQPKKFFVRIFWLKLLAKMPKKHVHMKKIGKTYIFSKVQFRRFFWHLKKKILNCLFV